MRGECAKTQAILPGERRSSAVRMPPRESRTGSAIGLVERTDNVILDMTAMQRHCWAVEFLATRVNPHRLTWGSDSPFIDPGLILGAVVHADIPEDVREAVLYGNLARILRIEITDGLIKTVPA